MSSKEISQDTFDKVAALFDRIQECNDKVKEAKTLAEKLHWQNLAKSYDTVRRKMMGIAPYDFKDNPKPAVAWRDR